MSALTKCHFSSVKLPFVSSVILGLNDAQISTISIMTKGKVNKETTRPMEGCCLPRGGLSFPCGLASPRALFGISKKRQAPKIMKIIPISIVVKSRKLNFTKRSSAFVNTFIQVISAPTKNAKSAPCEEETLRQGWNQTPRMPKKNITK